MSRVVFETVKVRANKTWPGEAFLLVAIDTEGRIWKRTHGDTAWVELAAPEKPGMDNTIKPPLKGGHNG